MHYGCVSRGVASLIRRALLYGESSAHFSSVMERSSTFANGSKLCNGSRRITLRLNNRKGTNNEVFDGIVCVTEMFTHGGPLFAKDQGPFRDRESSFVRVYSNSVEYGVPSSSCIFLRAANLQRCRDSAQGILTRVTPAERPKRNDFKRCNIFPELLRGDEKIISGEIR